MSAARARLVAWLAGRAPRERALLGVAAAGALAAGLALAAAAVRDDLAALRARVAGRTRELAEVRRLAAALGRPAAVEGADGGSLVARLETVAGDVVGRERIESMTPTSEAEDGLVTERVSLRVRGASLEEAVRLLHALEGERPQVGVTRLELRKHPDHAGRFDAAVEVARLRRLE